MAQHGDDGGDARSVGEDSLLDETGDVGKIESFFLDSVVVSRHHVFGKTPHQLTYNENKIYTIMWEKNKIETRIV